MSFACDCQPSGFLRTRPNSLSSTQLSRHLRAVSNHHRLPKCTRAWAHIRGVGAMIAGHLGVCGGLSNAGSPSGYSALPEDTIVHPAHLKYHLGRSSGAVSLPQNVSLSGEWCPGQTTRQPNHGLQPKVNHPGTDIMYDRACSLGGIIPRLSDIPASSSTALPMTPLPLRRTGWLVIFHGSVHFYCCLLVVPILSNSPPLSAILSSPRVPSV